MVPMIVSEDSVRYCVKMAKISFNCSFGTAEHKTRRIQSYYDTEFYSTLAAV